MPTVSQSHCHGLKEVLLTKTVCIDKNATDEGYKRHRINYTQVDAVLIAGEEDGLQRIVYKLNNKRKQYNVMSSTATTKVMTNIF